MVLAELGSQLAQALNKLHHASNVDENVFKTLLNEITRALMAADVDVHLIHELNAQIKNRVNIQNLPSGVNTKKVIEKAAVDEITGLLDTERKPYKPKRGRPNVIMFVGLQGSGKTTTCTKLAYHYRLRGWKVGLVCADTFRAGAFAQLRMNATKAKIPYYGSLDETDPVQIAMQGVQRFKEKRFEIIIVDTSGRHKQEDSLFEEMEAIADAVQPDDTIFVVDSTIGQQARPQAEAFRSRVDVGSVIVTKLDGHAKGGGALSAVSATNAPIIYIGTGEHINQLEEFDTQRFVQRILGRGDIQGLAQRVKDLKLDDNEGLVKRIKSGKFSLRDMRDQFQNILKMGSIGSIMSMIPGLNGMSQDNEEASQLRLRRFLVMMDSMTEEELDADIKLIEESESRIRRIARGSGCHVFHIRELIAVFKPFAQAAKKMGKLPFGKNGELPKNPKDVGQLANMIPPHLLKQMGGVAGFMDFAKKFEGADGGASAMAGMQNLQAASRGMQRKMRTQRVRRR